MVHLVRSEFKFTRKSFELNQKKNDDNHIESIVIEMTVPEAVMKTNKTATAKL